ncbi:hypothetical protein LTR36_001605 [Oleoguttula mirabilis]|uniref:RNI-like protein n=1 Tax=Oleoguttula mirabilis TaxID=1507867 RepID=A0AAV9JNE0_9PEZI|nr:hypothetical protein LTR36_001605 [Oleoguttula mirabilis]
MLSRTSSTGKGSGEGRRASWLNNISSKFSSSSQTPTLERQAPLPAAVPKQVVPTPPTSNGTPSAMPTHAEEAEETERNTPSKPKDSSFFSSLTRRLSSASTNAAPRVHGTGGMCPRRVLNVDPNRERCLVPEMDPNKLRRVSFCVDVEIAGGPRYVDDGDEVERTDKKKDVKLKERAEGEALKRPQAMQDEKDTEGETKLDAKGSRAVRIPQGDLKENSDLQEDDAEVGASPPNDAPGGERDSASRKKEKKKRSEEERKERKEKRRKRAEENGSIPVELQAGDDQDDQASVGSTSTPPTSSLPNVSAMDVAPPVGSFPDSPVPAHLSSVKQDKPTTDPVRIYRRCCQLRETPILKRITEQLMSPTCTIPLEPGVVNCLDLTGSRLQLADMVTLGDWLAVVPVKNIRLDDADINDEGVRCILSGLLAAKRPEPTKRRSVTPKHRERAQRRPYQERAGVVEKITFKNNPRISRQGWKHISLFIYMCRSLKAIDLSMNQFPETLPASAQITQTNRPQNAPAGRGQDVDAAETLYKCLSERSGGSRLEELIVSECGLAAPQIRKIVDGAIMCGISRLGLAGNHLDDEGLGYIIRYLKSGICQGLDIGGNDLRGKLGMIAEAIYSKRHVPCWGMSLAGCNLICADLKALFPALVKLPDFRFIDLSHNRDLMRSEDTVSLFRRFMTQFKELKRVHLADVGMSPKQAIALADCLPDGPRLAHLNILENPQLTALASAKDEAAQEEACALYASLMAAVRVSSTLICIDIDVPSPDNSEVVKALAKQVVAYSLRNMEQFAIAEVTGNAIPNAAAKLTQPHGGEKHVKEITVPDVLMHLVGHIEGSSENHDGDEPAPDDDYIVGGTGVVKALQYVLGEKQNDMRRSSVPGTPISGSMTPRDRPGSSAGLPPTEEERGKAKKMSKNLLESARKIRSRLQPALVKEATAGDELAYRRLLFLDQTLQNMIERFEREYPECRLAPPSSPKQAPSIASNLTDQSNPRTDLSLNTQATDYTSYISDDEDLEEAAVKSHIPRHGSEVSLAGRALSLEEGNLHRLGQKIRREVIDSPAGATSPQSPIQDHARLEALEAIPGSELKRMVEGEGWDNVLKKVGANHADLRRMQEQDPVGWALFHESQVKARMNLDRDRPSSRGV